MTTSCGDRVAQNVNEARYLAKSSAPFGTVAAVGGPGLGFLRLHYAHFPAAFFRRALAEAKAKRV
jgi:hypothetical protein